MRFVFVPALADANGAVPVSWPSKRGGGMTTVTGHKRGRKRGVPIYFDPDQIDAINKWRSTEHMNFSEAVRTLVEWGMEGASPLEDEL